MKGGVYFEEVDGDIYVPNSSWDTVKQWADKTRTVVKRDPKSGKVIMDPQKRQDFVRQFGVNEQ